MPTIYGKTVSFANDRDLLEQIERDSERSGRSFSASVLRILRRAVDRGITAE